MSDTKVRIQDDLYMAVNGKWLETAVIPDDRPRTGGFSDLDQAVEKILMDDFKAFAEGSKVSDIPEMQYATALYRKVLDTERRNREGITPLLPLLEDVAAIRSSEALNSRACELLMKGVPLPIQVDIDTDMQDASKHAVIIMGPDIILPDTNYYAKDHPAGKRLLAAWKDMAAKVLAFTPLSEAEQKQYLDDTLAFDALAAQKVKSQLEWAEYVKCYNPMAAEEAAKQVKPFDLCGLLRALYGDDAPETLIVYDPKAIREMKSYFSAENLGLCHDAAAAYGLPFRGACCAWQSLPTDAYRRRVRPCPGKAGLPDRFPSVCGAGRGLLRPDLFWRRGKERRRGSCAQDH